MTRRLYTLASWCRTFRCHVSGYIPCYLTLKSSAHIHFPIRLRADLQQIESKGCLFTPRQAGHKPSERPAGLRVNGSTLIIVSYGLLLCLLPVRGLKLGNILVLHLTVLAVPGVVLVLPALFVHNDSTLPPCRPQRLGVEVPCHIGRRSLWRSADWSSWGKMKHLSVIQAWGPVWRTDPCRVRCRCRRSCTSTWYPLCQPPHDVTEKVVEVGAWWFVMI